MFGMGVRPNAYMLVYVRRDLAAEMEGSEEPTGALLPSDVQGVFEQGLLGSSGRRKGVAAGVGAGGGALADDGGVDVESIFG